MYLLGLLPEAAYKFALSSEIPTFLYSMHREPVITVKTDYIEVRTASHFNETLYGHLFLNLNLLFVRSKDF